MKVRSRQTAVAGLGLVVILGMTPVAIAATHDPAPPTASPTGKRPPLDTGGLSGLASSLHISVPRLSAGLIAAKSAGGTGAAAVTAFSRAAGTSAQVATTAVLGVFGPASGGGITSPPAVTAVSDRLHMSRSAAADALARLAVLGHSKGGVDPSSPDFLALAHRLGVTPQQLATALAAAKVASGK